MESVFTETRSSCDLSALHQRAGHRFAHPLAGGRVAEPKVLLAVAVARGSVQRMGGSCRVGEPRVLVGMRLKSVAHTAAATVITVPVLVLSIIVQRYLAGGLESGKNLGTAITPLAA